MAEQVKQPANVIRISDRAPVASGFHEYDIGTIEDVLRRSALFSLDAERADGLEHAAHAMAKQILGEALDTPETKKVMTLKREEQAAVLAFALALGFKPHCSLEEFRRITEHIGLDIDADTEICPTDSRSLEDVLGGFDQAGVQAPFIDAFCTRASGEGAGEIRELLIVGRGLGITRELVQDIAFGAALSLEGRGTLCDGMIHLVADEPARVVALIGRQVPGLLNTQSGDRQLILDFAWSELKATEERSAFVRTHDVSLDALETLKQRVRALEETAPSRGAFLLPDPEASGSAATCVSLPVRGSMVAPQVGIPKEVVNSFFFERTLGSFERNILEQLFRSAERRAKFYEEELEQDRDRLAGVVTQARALLGAMSSTPWKDQANFKRLEREVTRALERLVQGDDADQPDAEGFGTLIALAYDFSCHVVDGGSYGAGSPVFSAARALRETLEEEALLTFQVVGGLNPRRILLAVPKSVRALEYIGKTLPANILTDLEWLKKARELEETIKSAKNAEGLRRWTAAVVLDLVMRGKDLDFGGAPAAGFREFRRATRPLLLLLLARALKDFEHSLGELSSPNLAFSCVAEEAILVLVPMYFVDGAMSSLSFRPGARVATLGEPLPQAERPPESAAERGVFRRTWSAMFGGDPAEKSKKPASDLETVGVALAGDPVEALADIFAAQPEQRVSTATNEVAGIATATLTNTLDLIGAPAAAALVAARGIYHAHAGKAPFTQEVRQNHIPELAWICLHHVLLLQLALEPTPAEWLHLDRATGTERFLGNALIGTWLDELASGAPRAGRSGSLPSTPALRELVGMCHDVGEAWQPGFLKRKAAGSEAPSERLRLLRKILQGHDPDGARQLGIDCDGVRKAWARNRGDAIHLCIPPLTGLAEFAATVVKADRGQVPLAAQVAADLSTAFIALGSLHGQRMHELLDVLFGARSQPQRPN